MVRAKVPKIAKQTLADEDLLQRELVNCLVSGVGRRTMAKTLERLWRRHVANRRKRAVAARSRWPAHERTHDD